MRFTLLTLIVLASLAQPAAAQELNLEGEIVADPICFNVRNTAPHKAYGTIGTNYYLTQDGTKARHRSNFRLEPVGSKDEKGYPADAAEFCSYGPFFEGQKLEFVLKTLFPVFSCYTAIDQGEIVIKSKRKEDDSGNDIWAECFE